MKYNTIYLHQLRMFRRVAAIIDGHHTLVNILLAIESITGLLIILFN